MSKMYWRGEKGGEEGEVGFGEDARGRREERREDVESGTKEVKYEVRRGGERYNRNSCERLNRIRTRS
jgi:hypothetical protein